MDEIKREALEAIDAARGSLVALADRLHQHPEVGFEERQASAWLVELLQAEGFVVEYPVGGMDTAFRARLGADSPTVALIAEYDALPEIGHGCGHNLIAAGAVGAALGVAAVLPKIGGTLLVIGTPAEERLFERPGKVRLLEAGVFEGVDAAIMFHPWTSNFIVSGDRAVVTLDIEFHGRAAHAAADPWNGANALDGVTLTFAGVNALRQQLKPDVRIHWKVTHGGDVPNIIHAYAATRMMVRSEDQNYLYNDVLPKVENCARGAALATGTQVTIQRISPIDATLNNPVLARVYEKAAADLGIKFDPPALMGGSTDFGNVSRALPASYFMLDIGAPKDAAWHSKAVAEAAGKPPAHRAMLDAARILALSAIDLLREPALTAEAWAAHPKRA